MHAKEQNYFNNIIIPSSVNYNNEEYVVDSISVECFKDNKNIKIIQKKLPADGVTLSLGIEDWSVRFE